MPWKPTGLLLVFGAWTLVAALISASVLYDAAAAGRRIAFAQVPLAFAEAYTWAALTPVIFWLVHRYATERPSIWLRFLIFAGGGLVTIFIVAAVMQFLRQTFNAADIRRPFAPFSAIGIAVETLAYTAVLIAGFARHYAALRTQTAQLRAQLADARLTALRAQLNPHFLFNTLHAISALAATDPRGVRRMLSQLSDLLRMALNDASAAETPLSMELAFIRRYLDLMRVQLRPTIEILEHIDESAINGMVPTLLLQPLIENAIKHGISHLPEGGQLSLDAHRVDGQLQLVISNSSPTSIRDRPLVEGLGLRNTRERLQQLYGGNHTLQLRSSARSQTKFTVEITLPFHVAPTQADVKRATTF